MYTEEGILTSGEGIPTSGEATWAGGYMLAKPRWHSARRGGGGQRDRSYWSLVGVADLYSYWSPFYMYLWGVKPL